MFDLAEHNIHLNARADNKQQAIQMIATALEQGGYVESGYVAGMLAREQQTSTFLGNGIAIPHGSLDTREMIKKTGVQIFQFPQGIAWDQENIVYVVIGIAARSDEHLALLRQLTKILDDEERAKKLASVDNVAQFKAIFTGEVTAFKVLAEEISLDVDCESLLTLSAINLAQLQQQNAIDNSFIAQVINGKALPLGQGLWLMDSAQGNLKNMLTFSRAKQPFQYQGKLIHGLLTIAYIDEKIQPTLARLLQIETQQQLITGDQKTIVAALNGELASIQNQPTVIGIFTVRNEHGLHARPSALLVNEVKKFSAKISVENLSLHSSMVNAKSLMKVVGLGAACGHRLRFVAQGEDSLVAIKQIGQGIAKGLGEQVATTPSQQDSIEIVDHFASNLEDNLTLNQAREAIFVIDLEQGLQSRQSARLVNEVKKYNASVAVQNLDRQTPLVSAKSLMKVASLDIEQGHRLRFVATGDESEQAIKGISKIIKALANRDII